MKTKTCKKCKQEKSLLDFPSSGYYTTQDGQRCRSYKPVCKPCLVEDMKTKRDALWNKYFDPKCSVCGYDRCRSALEIHHTDGDEKDFTFAARYSISEERFAKEAQGCVVLCANCHREEHERLRNLGA